MAGRFLKSRSTWDIARLGPSVVEMVISVQGLSQLVYCLCLTEAGKFLNSSAMLTENVCLLFPEN